MSKPIRFWGIAGQMVTRIGTIVVGGAGIGVVVALALFAAKATSVALLPIGIAIILPALVLRNPRLYWFALLLLSLQFTVGKNLNDGFVVLQQLKIDYTIENFTFSINGSDLPLVVLMAICANDVMFHDRKFRFPRVTWFAIAYVGIGALSILVAPSQYLGLVELSRELRLLAVFLLAVNLLDTKAALRVLVVASVAILTTQAAMTTFRFETGYMTPLVAGETHQDVEQIKRYLAVDRSVEGSSIRAFGTLGSPGTMLRLCLLVIPFTLFLCVRNPMFKLRPLFLALTAFGLFGLVLTFTRVYYITTAFQLVLVVAMMVRDRMLGRGPAILLLVLFTVGLAAISPKLYEQFTVRSDSVSVRLLQYEASIQMISDHPLLGVGLNNGIGEKQRYNRLTYHAQDPNTQFDKEQTHNMYLSMSSEIGLVGMAAFLAFFTRIGWIAWKEARTSPDPEIRWAASALVVVLLSVALNATMDPFDEYPVLTLLWLQAGIVLNLSSMSMPPKQPGRLPPRGT